jgi:hypothetical protein
MDFDFFKSAGHDDTWWWEHGNYACDCNRELAWRDAGGEGRDFDAVECSHGRFTLDHIELPDGTTFKLEEPEPWLPKHGPEPEHVERVTEPTPEQKAFFNRPMTLKFRYP